ncbi:MAG: 1-deoxy-D-xylulose-5-phosphate reductoisomerase [Porticoccaceae bacterium]|nr:1-deoxy-D-xylulose-5-phosphate reductoisomerase [Porticoccaceae bacterium]
MSEKITILGSSGSIGESTLDVIARHPERYEVFALTGRSRVDVLARQCRRFMPRYVVVGSEQAASLLREQLDPHTTVLWGAQALVDVAADSEVDTVMAAIVGAAGLLPTLAAAEKGKRVLLANKESLVMAGGLFMDAVARHGATLLPIDSEHNAIFQCLPPGYRQPGAAGVSKILLSASGGPFRTTALAALATVTPAQACAHPNWAMGQKISVDSATMMNKGLELIEACWLFNVPADAVEVVIHPQSIVHSLVAYVDGSVLAQLGNPDMRTPIAHALAWPERIDSGVAPLDLVRVAQLSFETPDLARFPCLELAQQAARSGQDYPAALNAANEVAVAAFLGGRIGFTHIATVVADVLDSWQGCEPVDLAAVQQSDKLARELAMRQVEVLSPC